MRKHSFLLISLIWIIAAVFNFCDEASLITVLFNAFAAFVFLSLYILQFVLDKRGESGKKIFKRICIGYMVILCIILCITVVYGAYKFL